MQYPFPVQNLSPCKTFPRAMTLPSPNIGCQRPLYCPCSARHLLGWCSGFVRLSRGETLHVGVSLRDPSPPLENARRKKRPRAKNPYFCSVKRPRTSSVSGVSPCPVLVPIFEDCPCLPPPIGINCLCESESRSGRLAADVKTSNAFRSSPARSEYTGPLAFSPLRTRICLRTAPDRGRLSS